MDDLDDAIRRAAYLASWSLACGWKRAKNCFIADIVLYSWTRAEAERRGHRHHACKRSG